MERIERSQQKYAELFWNIDISALDTDPDFADILNRFIYGDVYYHDSLNDRQRELITLCIISALGGCENQLRSHIHGNLNVGNDKELMIEAVTNACLIWDFQGL